MYSMFDLLRWMRSPPDGNIFIRICHLLYSAVEETCDCRIKDVGYDQRNRRCVHFLYEKKGLEQI